MRSHVTSRGRITLPRPLREALGIKPGDKIDFHADADGKVKVVKLGEPWSASAVAALRESLTAGFKTE